MERLDAVLVEHILRLLPPHALAAAESTCRQWAELMTQRQLWRAHAAAGVQLSSGDGIAAVGGSTPRQAARVDWRHTCLQQAAAAKWRAGKLLLSATLPGHTAPITCIVTLQHIIATGSSDCSTRVWDLQQGSQLHLLRHAEPVVAVALPNVNVCVTATAKSAHLWRQGKAIRRFDVTPGGSIICLALTDTQLLLGSTVGAVQHFDLFSGSQQLITRHGSSVTCLLAQQQQQQQQQQGLAAAEEQEDWHIIVGTADGQVSCMAASTGTALWQLPTKYPARVVAFSVQQYHQQQQQHVQHHSKKLRQEHQQQQRVSQVLFALNARSQLVCWQLQGGGNNASQAASQLQLPTCKNCIVRLLNISKTCGKAPRINQDSKAAVRQAGQASTGSATAVTAAGPDAATAAAPASQVAATPAGVNSSAAVTGSSCSSNSNVKPLAVCELPVQPATGLLSRLTSHNVTGCSSLACPEFGNTCLFVGSSDGHLSMAELAHASSSSSSSAAGEGDRSSKGGPGSSGSSQEAEDAALLPQQQQGAAAASVDARDVAAAAAYPVGLQHTMAGCADGSSSSASGSSGCVLQLQLARRCPLGKLAKLVGQRASKGAVVPRTAARKGLACTAAAAAAAVGVLGSSKESGAARSGGGNNNNNSNVAAALGSKAAASETSQTAEAAGVRCAVFTACGRLAVGLASGHVCLLRFRASG